MLTPGATDFISSTFTSKTVDEAITEKEKENAHWRPLIFHLFASLEIDRLVELLGERTQEREELHKRVSELELLNKQLEGASDEIFQLRQRERELKRLADDSKAEADGLRTRISQLSGEGAMKAMAETVESLEKQNSMSKFEIERLIKVIATKEQEMRELVAGSSDVDEMARRHKNEIETWKKKVKDRDNEKDELVSQREELLLQIQDLKKRLAEKKDDGGLTAEMLNEVHFYQQEIDSLKSKIGGYENEIEELGNLNNFLTAQHREADDKTKELESKLKMLTLQLSENESTSGDLEDFKTKLRKSELEVRRLTDSLEENIKSHKIITKQFETIQTELQEQRTRADKAIRDKNKAIEDVEDANMKLGVLEKKISLKDEEIGRYQSQISSARGDNANSRVLESQLQSLERRIREIESERDTLVVEKKTLHQKLILSEESKGSVSGPEVDALRDKLKASNTKISELETELRSRRGASNTLQDRLAEIEELKNTEVSLRSQLRNLREELESVSREAERGKVMNAGLEAQMRELGSISTVLRDKNREIQELEARLGEAQDINKDLKMRMIELEQSIPRGKVVTDRTNELSREIEQLRNILRFKDDEIKKVSNEAVDGNELRKKADVLLDEVSSLRRQLEKVTVQRDRYKADNDEVKAALESANLQRFKIDEQNYRIAALETEIEVKSKKVAFFESENENLNSRMKTMKKSLDTVEDLRNEAMSLREENARLKRTEIDCSQQIEVLNSQIRQLKDKAELSSSERDRVKRLEREVANKNEEIDSHIQSFKELQLQFEELKRELEDTNEADRLREELTRTQKVVTQLETTTTQKVRIAEEELSEIRRKLAEVEEAKLVAARDHQVQSDILTAKTKELERALMKTENAGKLKEFQFYEEQLSELRQKLARSDIQRVSEVSELRHKILELQKLLAESKQEMLDRFKNRSSEDSEMARLHRTIEDLTRTIERKNQEILSLRSNTGAVSQRGVSDSEGREELEREIALLREKLRQKEEYIDKEIRRARISDRSVERRRGDGYTTASKHEHLAQTVEGLAQDKETLVDLLQKKEREERELRRTITVLQKELEDQRRYQKPSDSADYGTNSHHTPTRGRTSDLNSSEMK